MTSDGAEDHNKPMPRWLWPAAYAAYVLAAALGLALAFPGTNASPFWPPTALALAILYRFGLRLWPVILAGAFTINLLFMLRAGIGVEPAFAASIAVGFGNMLEALIGVYILRAVAGEQFPFGTILGLVAFFAAIAIAPVISASIGVSVSRWASMGGTSSYAQNWLTWWVGDSSGALTMAPVLMLLLRQRPWRVPDRFRLIEAVGLFMALALGSLFAFGMWQHHGGHPYPLMFLLLPLILWAVLRFQNAGAATAVFVIASSAVLSSITGSGPFVMAKADESLMLLQIFIIILAGTTLILAAVLTERSRLLLSLAQSNAELNDMAFNDALTGLPNRRALVERVQQAARSARRHHKHAAILFLDLDRFKRINDSLGHAVGDELLKAVARRLQDALREEDSVCRLGGDEFVVLLWDVDAATDAAIVAQKLVATLRAPLRLANLDLGVTTSIGIALLPDDGSDADDVIRYADMAMYRAKERGRGTFQFYKDEMNRTALARLVREHELRGALNEGQFRLYYQPIVDLFTAQVIGVEALLRWQHPQRGLLLPHEFILLAEETGLIVEIGAWVLQQACRDIKQLRESVRQELRLSVNMSLRQLRDPNLPELIASVLTETDLDALWLNLEIAEDLLRDDVLAEMNFLHKLDRIGISLAVDNFGSAASSLSVLARLPVTIIKIDHRLVGRLQEDRTARDITLAMIAMAHQLGLVVVAENVEKAEQREFLTANGCDYAQGFLFHRPQPAAELTTLLKLPAAEHPNAA
jgi:diguanylate cyclase (GGDEF)-like protein